MKIISWNCHEAFYKKYKKLEQHDADIYVISEIRNPLDEGDEEYQEFSKNHIYMEYQYESEPGSTYKPKGIAIIAKEGIKLENNNWEFKPSDDFLSVRVNDSFDLIGVWTHPPYVENVIKYLRLHKDNFSKSDNLLMCGDFNVDIFKGNQNNKEMFVKILQSYGYESIYHYLNNKELNEEPQPTIYWRYHDYEPYHVDYLFTKPEILSSFEIGTYEEYVKNKLSDHVPLIFEVDI